jgi:hypothetical protein
MKGKKTRRKYGPIEIIGMIVVFYLIIWCGFEILKIQQKQYDYCDKMFGKDNWSTIYDRTEGLTEIYKCVPKYNATIKKIPYVATDRNVDTWYTDIAH